MNLSKKISQVKKQVTTKYPFEVRGDSMFPTFRNQQKIWIQKLDPEEKIERGQIVIFTLDKTNKPDIIKTWKIKRVVGLAGEQIIFRKGKLWIKSAGKEFELEEPYLGAVSSYKLGLKNYFEKGKENEDFAEVILLKNEHYLLGDNRTSSNDSRNFGVVDSDLIKYKVTN